MSERSEAEKSVKSITWKHALVILKEQTKSQIIHQHAQQNNGDIL